MSTVLRLALDHSGGDVEAAAALVEDALSPGELRGLLARLSLPGGAGADRDAAEVDADDPRARAELMAEILYGVYGTGALGALTGAAARLSAKWDALHHPRGKDGRFIPKGSPEAHAAAARAVRESKGRPATKEHVDSLAAHLALLKRDQLRQLAKEHGLKPPGKLREHLVQILLERMPGPKPAEKESPVDSAPNSSTMGETAATETAGIKPGEAMSETATTEPLKRRDGESAVDFLRRFAADPGAIQNWGDVARVINGLSRDEIAEAERVMAADPTKRDGTYPTTHIFNVAKQRYDEATAHRGRPERAAEARRLLDLATTTDDPDAVEKQWAALTDIFATSPLQRQALAEDLGVKSDHPNMVNAALDARLREKLRPARERQQATRAAARVEKLYAKPKDFGLTRRDLPKTPPPGAGVWTLDAQQDLRTGHFPGRKKGDVVTVQGRPCVVVAASAVYQVRDPELGILARRQHVLTRPATAEEADAAEAAKALERWRRRTEPFDDYTVGGYQTDAQRAEAEEWVRRYKADPLAAYRAEKAGAR